MAVVVFWRIQHLVFQALHIAPTPHTWNIICFTRYFLLLAAISKLSHYNPITIGNHNLSEQLVEIQKSSTLFPPVQQQRSSIDQQELNLSNATNHIERKTFHDQNFVFCAIHQNIDQNLIVRYSLLLTQRLGVRQLLTLVLCILSLFSLW